MNTPTILDNRILHGEVSPLNSNADSSDRIISDLTPTPIAVSTPIETPDPESSTEQTQDVTVANDNSSDRILHGEVSPLDPNTGTSDRIISNPIPASIAVSTPIETPDPQSPTEQTQDVTVANDNLLDRAATVSPIDDSLVNPNPQSRVESDPLPQLSLAQPNLLPIPDFPFPIPIPIPSFKPDLSGKSFNVIQEPLNAGDSFDLNFEVQNTGLANAGGFWADFYLSSDPNISNAAGSSDVLLGFQWVSSLAAGTTTGSLSKNLTLPDASNSIWSNGNSTYYVGMISDALGNVAESNESNNASTAEFADYDGVFVTALSPGIDLSGKSFNVVQEPLNSGDSFDVNFEVQNTGSDNAGGFWADFYLSTDANISNAAGSGDVLLGYQWISSLAGGSTTGSLTKNLSLPAASHPIWDSIGDGTYYIGMISDALGNVAETNESNNASTAEFVDYDGVFVDTSVLNFDLDFKTSGQNLWGSGTAFNIGHDKFFGPQWNKSGSKTIASVGVQGSTSGKIGFQSDLDVDGGSVNADLPIALWLDIPNEVKPGEVVTIKSGFKLDNSATFSTASPTASYDLDLVFDVEAKAGLTAFGKNANIVDFDINKTKNLVSIDSQGASYSLSESQLNGFGSFDLHVPKIDTNGNVSGTNSLSAQGSDNFFEANLDLDKLATTLLNAVGVPVPPLEKNFSLLGLGVGYNLLDVDLEADLNLKQQFGLQVDELTGQLILENGQAIDFVVGQDVSFTVPNGIGDSLEVDALLDLGADFSNKTSLGYDTDADLEALSVNAKANLPWPIPDIDVTLGPLVDQNYNLFDGDIGLYNKTFDLGGFNSESLSFDIAVAA